MVENENFSFQDAKSTPSSIVFGVLSNGVEIWAGNVAQERFSIFLPF